MKRYIFALCVSLLMLSCTVSYADYSHIEDFNDFTTITDLESSGWSFIQGEGDDIFTIENNRLKIERTSEDSATRPILKYNFDEPVSEMLEISFDMEMVTSSSYALPFFGVYSGTQLIGGITNSDSVFTLGSTAYDTGTTKYFPVPGTTEKWWNKEYPVSCTMKMVYDFENGTYTGYCSGVEATNTGGAFVKPEIIGDATSADSFAFYFGRADGRIDPYTVYLDNISVKKLQVGVPSITGASITEGQTDVSITQPISLYFSEIMDTDSLITGISLYKEEIDAENRVEATITCSNDEKSYTLTPTANLSYETDYILVISNEVKSKQQVQIEGTQISFKTQPEPELFSFYEDFSAIDDSAEVTDIVEYFNSKFSHFQYKFGMTSAPWGWCASDNDKGANMPEGETFSTLITDTNTMKIEDGCLKLMKSNPNYGHEWYFDLDKINSGIVRVSFDVSFAEGTPPSYNTQMFALYSEDQKKCMSLGYNGSNVYVSGTSDGWQDSKNLLSNSFKSGTNKLSLIVDFDRGKAYVVLNGVKSPEVTCAQTDFGILGIFIQKHLNFNGLYIDNLYISNNKSAEVTECSIADESVNVDPSTQLTITFNTKIDALNANKIKLYEGENVIEEPQYELSDDGLSLVIGKKLKYSTPYKIILGDGILATNDVSFVEKSISFHTMHEPYAITVENIRYTDADDNEISDLSTAHTVYIRANCTNVSDADANVTLIGVVYRNDQIKESSIYKAQAIRSGESLEIAVPINLPKDKTNLSIKGYIWDSLQTMRPLVTVR